MMMYHQQSSPPYLLGSRRCVSWRLSIAILLAGCVSASECLMVPLAGHVGGVAQCLDESALIPYYIDIAVPPEEASRRLLGCQLNLILDGQLGRLASAETITNSVNVVETTKTIYSAKLGKIVGGEIIVGSSSSGRGACSHAWGCQSVTVRDGHRFWKLDCEGFVSKSGDRITLSLAGAKHYRIQVITDPQLNVDASSSSMISLRLLGADGAQSGDLALLGATRTPGIAYTADVTAADVGSVISAINVTNRTPNAPWKFKTITVNTADGSLAKFSGSQYVGTPYSSSLIFPNAFLSTAADSVSVTALFFECHTRLSDVVSGEVSGYHKPSLVKIHCPAGCDSSPLTFVVGLSLHPSASSVCAAAVADGSLNMSGGEILLQLYPADPSRDLSSLYLNVTDITIHPYRDSLTKADDSAIFTTTRLRSLDDLDSSIRVVDQFQELSHTGRLEIRSADGVWGSVCTHGSTEQFNFEAAKIACQELGYLWGSILSASCGSLNLCGASTLPILAGGIVCKGNEDSFGACAVQDPGSICEDHTHDQLIHCTDTPPTLNPESGTLRIIDSGGMPAIRGFGRLEIFIGHHWSSICNDRWDRRAAGVACREMGYIGANSIDGNGGGGGGGDQLSSGGGGLGGGLGGVEGVGEGGGCEDFMGANLCGDSSLPIGMTDVVCDGSEERLRDCSFSAPEDVYCVHSEDVIISCVGSNGDPSGIGMFAKEHKPSLRMIPFQAPHTIRCTDTFESLFSGEADPLPGALYLVRCPANCSKSKGSTLIGHILYTTSSSLCLAALHSGVIDDSGMVVGIQATHGQYHFIGKRGGSGLVSEEGGEANDSFMPVKLVDDLSSRLTTSPGASDTMRVGGGSLLNPKFMLNRENYKRPFTINEIAQATSEGRGGGASSSSLSFLQTSASTNQPPPLPLVSFCNEGNVVARFDGSITGEIVMNNLPGGTTLISLTSFSVILRFRTTTTTTSSGWRSILSYGECDGFNIVISPENELIMEQLCTPLIIHTQIYPEANVWKTITLTYDEGNHKLNFYDSFKPQITDHDVTQSFRWSSQLRLGKSSTLEYEPFIGEISQAFIYNRAIGGGEVASAINMLKDTCNRLSPLEPTVDYSDQDYRICLTDCQGGRSDGSLSGRGSGISSHSTSQLLAHKLMSREKSSLSSLPALPLDCLTTLDSSRGLNSKLGDEIEVICPMNCFTEKILDTTASKLDSFPGSFPICSAAHVLGFIPARGQRLRMKILPGKSNYLPSSLGPVDLDLNMIKKLNQKSDIRSFTITSITQPRTISCHDTAEFLAFAEKSDTHLFRCPSGCKGSTAAAVGVNGGDQPGVRGDSEKYNMTSMRIERPKIQLKHAQSAQGLLLLHNFRTPICSAAIDAGVLKSSFPSDVLVHLEAAPPKAGGVGRGGGDLTDLDNALMLDLLEIPSFKGRRGDVERGVEVEGDEATDDVSLTVNLNRSAYSFREIPLTPKCSDVTNRSVSSSEEVSSSYYCNGSARISGTIATTPAWLRIPELNFAVHFLDSKNCRVTSLAGSPAPPTTDRSEEMEGRIDYQVTILPGRKPQFRALMRTLDDDHTTVCSSTSGGDEIEDFPPDEPYSFHLSFGMLNTFSIEKIDDDL